MMNSFQQNKLYQLGAVLVVFLFLYNVVKPSDDPILNLFWAAARFNCMVAAMAYRFNKVCHV